MRGNEVCVFSYTRAEAIADGVLVDVSKLAAEACFRYPVAVTAGVWAECVKVPDGVAGQDETGRLWDVLNVLRASIAKLREPHTTSRVDFAVHVRNDDREGNPPLVRLYAVCGPGDSGEPVITVMKIGED